MRSFRYDRRRPHLLLPLLAVLLGAGACRHGSKGEVVVVSATDTFVESEPNGCACDPDPIATVAPGDELVIHGNVADFGPDVIDGFQLFAFEPLEVHFRLVADDPFTDLDLCVYDPAEAALDPFYEYSLCYESGGNVEAGSFVVDGFDYEFHLVVLSFQGSSSYRLEIEVDHASFPAAFSTSGSAPGETGAIHGPPAPGGGRSRPELEAYGHDAAAHEAPAIVGAGAAILFDPATGAVEPASFVTTEGASGRETLVGRPAPRGDG